MDIGCEPFGSVGDQPVERYTLTSAGLTVRILTYGGVVQSLEVPGRDGRTANVALGLASLDEYVADSPYFGALIGRFANRIARGRFVLDGAEYALPVNNGPNCLHGGALGFDKSVWQATPSPERNALHLALISPDGDQGFPGALAVEVTYTLRAAELQLDYRATTDRPTVVNLTNHTYFNLGGEGSGSVEDHVVTVQADQYTPIDATLIPTGSLAPVADTPLDFRQPTAIGARLRTGGEQLIFAQGYDHNFVLRRGSGDNALVAAARVEHPTSGRVLEAFTTEPGLQFYTGNLLDATLRGSSGRAYRQTDAFTLETQHFPDAPNQPDFPSTVLRAGEVFTSRTVFRFPHLT